MDIARILNFGCAIILVICLILVTVSATGLSRTQQESRALLERAEVLLTTQQEQESDTTATPEADPSQPTGADPSPAGPTYRIRAAGNRIGVYTAEDLPICTFDIDPSRLPEADRTALEGGIPMDSWAAVLSYLSDYTS